MTECIVCGTDRWEPWWGMLRRCQGCGFARAAEMPDPAASASLYTAGYFAGEEYGNYLADRDLHRRNFAARLRDVRRLAGALRSVYEVGCAYGFWLELAAEQGMRAEGIDVCREAVVHAVETLGRRATLGEFTSAAIEPGAFDAFCMWDTLEHLSRPEEVVGRAAELLPAGGWLFLTTPDAGSLVARCRGRRWRMVHPPTHLHYFTRPTIRRFLDRHGLETVETRAVGVYRTLGSVLSSMAALRKGWPGTSAAWLRARLPGGLQRCAGAWVNLGDIMFVAARKP